MEILTYDGKVDMEALHRHWRRRKLIKKAVMVAATVTVSAILCLTTQQVI